MGSGLATPGGSREASVGRGLGRLLLGALFLALLSGGAPARDWAEIVESGVLRVAAREAAGSLYLGRMHMDRSNPAEPGLAYELVRDFAQAHDLDVEMVPLQRFADIWAVDGTPRAPEPGMPIPDIFDRVDLVAEYITVTPDRAAVVHLTPILANREIVFGHRDIEAEGYADLIGHRIGTFEAMSFAEILRAGLQAQGVPFREVAVSLPRGGGPVTVLDGPAVDPELVSVYLVPRDAPDRSRGFFLDVARGDVDASLSDAMVIVFRMATNGLFKENLQTLFPARETISQLAWASRPQDRELNRQLAAFLAEDRASGRFSERLARYTGFTLAEYEALIGMAPANTIGE